MARSFLNIPQSALTTNAYGDSYLYSVNRSTFENVSARVVYENAYKTDIFEENTLIIIVGTDSGLLPRYIHSHGVPAGTRYVFIELEDVLQQIEQHHLLDGLSPEIVCSTFENWQKETEHFKIHEYFYINAVKSLDAICAQQGILDDYPALCWSLNELLQTLHWQYYTSIGCEAFIIRQLENTADTLIPAKSLEDAYRDKTVIILAGGPSLTPLLPWVKANREKLVVFSVSRISRQLINVNIEPDFVFSVDPQDISADVSKEMLSFGENTVFVFSYHVQPSLINQWHGKHLYLGARFPWDSELNPDNIDGVGPTVTNTALSVAHHFGFNRILLAGFDLCYTKEGITHAAGSNEQLAGPKYNLTSLQVETYAGEKRPTENGFYTALTVLSQQAKTISGSGKEIINLSQSAAKVDCIKHIPPEAIALDDLGISPIEIACRYMPNLTAQQLYAHYRSVGFELSKAYHQIKAIQSQAKKAIKINDSMFGRNGQIENYRDKRNLDAIEKKLNRKYSHFSALVKRFGIRKFLNITVRGKENWDADQVKKAGHFYYEAYLSGSTQLMERIEEAKSRIESRIEELKNEPDFALLFNQWEKDKSYRRAALWMNRQTNPLIDAKIKGKFDLFALEFGDFLNNDKSKIYAENRQTSRLPQVKTRAQLLFKHKKPDDLKNLYNALSNDPKEPNKAPYLQLITAFIAELEGDLTLALNEYDSVLNAPESPLIEETLTRIASVSIQLDNHENACLALECLAQLSPVYLPYYAESARILGQFIVAIDSYNAYISKFPNDTQIKLKLARLYFDNGAYDAAELMIDHLLAENANLQDARTIKQRLAELKE